MITSAVSLAKSHEKKCQDYFLVTKRNLNFEKMDTAPYAGKSDGFWLLWGICKEYIKENIIKAVLRKANAHSVFIYRLIKNRQCKQIWS